ncbi:MAG: tRNA (adenosine(37)-N6)-threonylcarbamoyltransferase complex ATPase subunit type 1 TsaE [bacterium]|nr:tRNA (adenosine(37)-N6)-threonylcarbamoyltransferase complex ATPase subunit type 1 TsaE [bacterium]
MSRLLKIVSHSEDETIALARKIVGQFPADRPVVLKGDLGAGKTVFVRGLAVGLGIDEAAVSSPSYTIVNEYPGTIPLFHFDLYRIGDPTELYEAGWEDYLLREGLMVVEWGEKAADLLPKKYTLIEFSILKEEEREIRISMVEPQVEKIGE